MESPSLLLSSVHSLDTHLHSPINSDFQLGTVLVSIPQKEKKRKRKSENSISIGFPLRNPNVLHFLFLFQSRWHLPEVSLKQFPPVPLPFFLFEPTPSFLPSRAHNQDQVTPHTISFKSPPSPLTSAFYNSFGVWGGERKRSKKLSRNSIGEKGDFRPHSGIRRGGGGGGGPRARLPISSISSFSFLSLLCGHSKLVVFEKPPKIFPSPSSSQWKEERKKRKERRNLTTPSPPAFKISKLFWAEKEKNRTPVTFSLLRFAVLSLSLSLSLPSYVHRRLIFHHYFFLLFSFPPTFSFWGNGIADRNRRRRRKGRMIALIVTSSASFSFFLFSISTVFFCAHPGAIPFVRTGTGFATHSSH